ncbi:MAG: transcription-repair coupling factor [Burkholderiales bacterium]|nr:transcription-repair coupling factor [Burkholderiales bacterium]
MILDAPLPAAGLRLRYAGLAGSSDALALAELAALGRPLVVLAATAADAQRLTQELPYFAPALRVFELPDWETLPYDRISPHQDLVSDRLATLYQMMQRAFDVVVIAVTTALYRLAPSQYLAGRTFFLKRGDTLDLERFRSQLALAGYSFVTQVVAPGEYCVRGGLIDLFPMGSALPYRIDLMDREIDTLRTFDVDSQRTIYKVNEIRLLPGREFPLDDEARTYFRRRFRERFEGDPSKREIYKAIGRGGAPAGIEYYLPLFFEHTATLSDYIPADALVCLHGDVAGAIGRFWQDTHSRFTLMRGDPDRPLLEPNEIFIAQDEFFGAVKPFARIELRARIAGEPVAPSEPAAASAITCATSPLPELAVERRAEDPLRRLKAFIERFDGRVLVAADSLGRRETMASYFAEYALRLPACNDYAAFRAGEPKAMLGVAPLAGGFVVDAERVAIVTENELYAAQARNRATREAAKRVSSEAMVRDLSEIRIGDPVVHEGHGIGRYQGLQTLDLGDGASEFLTLEFAGSDKLYVPVTQLHLISRYAGAAAEQVVLSTLGSGQWEKAKRRAAQQVRDTAAELLHLYAQRAARKGHSFKLKPHDYEAFCDAFPFEETPDQAAAISATVHDLEDGRPMDRLICGDVGFGKTEVALRAAFVAVMDGRQVAVLVPTTLLAEQHFQTFSDRFADWPVRIAELSRFRSGKEVSRALEGLASGQIDIVVGTHKIIQPDVKFKQLGLVIIDEEHRFGVRQKERLKAMRSAVDVLTLTATPIPRTLAMALEGLRDFSVIATAPQRRLAIKTFVSPTSPGLIREALLRELKRGGQVYFLHNDIDTIQRQEETLTRLVPEARIRVAHGKMRERELEQAMRDFYQQRFNVLLCTTIIETGIDVPSANTIVIDRADKFGLAQLHQLRGRVGRSHHQAYAYLLTPDEEAVSTQARKRLDAIQMMEELGSGFYLAMHDLEIRGAGEVLGEEQSGEMAEVGFNLYSSMLAAAVEALKRGQEPDLTEPLGITTEINLHYPALLPADYCSDVHERLVLYKRMASCASLESLDGIVEELIDRFGLPPLATQVLIEMHRLRILGTPLGVVRIDAGSEAVQLQFGNKASLDPARVIQLVQTRRDYRFAGQDKLRIAVPAADIALRIEAIKEAFRELAKPYAPATPAKRAR